MLSYLTAGLSLLWILFGAYPVGRSRSGSAWPAYGVANEKRWGYWLGIVLAGLVRLCPAARSSSVVPASGSSSSTWSSWSSWSPSTSIPRAASTNASGSSNQPGGRAPRAGQRAARHSVGAMTTTVSSIEELNKLTGPAPRVLRLARDRPGADRPLRRRHRRPPVDPRRPRAGRVGALRHHHRPRVPDPVDHPVDPARGHPGRGLQVRRELRLQQGPLPVPGQGGVQAPPRSRGGVGGERRRRRAPRSCSTSPSRPRARTSRRAWPRWSTATPGEQRPRGRTGARRSPGARVPFTEGGPRSPRVSCRARCRRR